MHFLTSLWFLWRWNLFYKRLLLCFGTKIKKEWRGWKLLTRFSRWGGSKCFWKRRKISSKWSSLAHHTNAAESILRYRDNITLHMINAKAYFISKDSRNKWRTLDQFWCDEKTFQFLSKQVSFIDSIRCKLVFTAGNCGLKFPQIWLNRGSWCVTGSVPRTSRCFCDPENKWINGDAIRTQMIEGYYDNLLLQLAREGPNVVAQLLMLSSKFRAISSSFG